jgi:hypothetical protein
MDSPFFSAVGLFAAAALLIGIESHSSMYGCAVFDFEVGIAFCALLSKGPRR